jgi:eukaryotic-like serine/threonine-protein kinase
VNLDLLPTNLHPRVREAITRCLQKDLRRRYPSITDARYEIEQSLADPAGVLVQSVVGAEPRTRQRKMLSWLAAAVVLAAIAGGAAVWNLKPPEPLPVIRFEYELPEDQRFNGGMAVSPNGKQFVYSTNKGLYLRSMDELKAKFIAGTEGGTSSFFSPDGKWLGYFSKADGKLKKIAIEGGEPIVLCAIENGGFISAWWSEDNTIVYGHVPGKIMRISANGGTPECLIKGKSWAVGLPQILPDGKSMLYSAMARMDDPNSLSIMVHSPKTRASKELLSGTGARYLPTGHIVYLTPKTNALCAIPFDVDRLEVAGESVTLMEGVNGFAASERGTLVYTLSTNAAFNQKTLVWVDRKGKEEPLAAEPKGYSFFQISPDGTRVALTVTNDGKGDIYIWDLVRQNMMKLTLDEAGGGFPLWTPDSKRILFASRRKDSFGIYCKLADDAGEVELLGSLSDVLTIPTSWSADGKTLVVYQLNPDSKADIGTLPMEGDKTIKLLLQRKYQEGVPQISPDGQWMAYSSDESGRLEVYVRPFPNVNSGKWKVSTSGGWMQLWLKNERELLYWTQDAKMMAVAIETAPAFKPGIPRVLFELPAVSSSYMTVSAIPWDISPDGKRFLMLKSMQRTEDAPGANVPKKIINIVLNWTEELKQRLQAK